MPDPDAEQVSAETPEDWRAWLAANHDRGAGVWLVTWKAETGRRRMTYEQSVVEALAYGWIDSTARRLDHDRSALWFAPRKPGSGWARTNKARVEQLEREGRMAPPGRAVIERAKADGSWTMLDDVENLVVPPDLAAALAARPGARDRYEAFPRSAKRAILVWIVEAKTPATRARRVNDAADKAARGERANQWQPREGRAAGEEARPR